MTTAIFDITAISTALKTTTDAYKPRTLSSYKRKETGKLLIPPKRFRGDEDGWHNILSASRAANTFAVPDLAQAESVLQRATTITKPLRPAVETSLRLWHGRAVPRRQAVDTPAVITRHPPPLPRQTNTYLHIAQSYHGPLQHSCSLIQKSTY